MNTTYNPWAGLSSYQDPEKSDVKLKFCGRDSDTYDVTRLIDDNFFITLYGKSGIGKTSLLNAGVFPALRREQYTPLSLRLGMSDDSLCFQDIITTAIERIVTERGGSIETIPVVEEQQDRQATDYLWNYFARHRFLIPEQLPSISMEEAGLTPTFPVIIFDQFEEVFRRAESRKKTEVLLTQLNYLIDESHALNDCIVEGEEYYYDFNFRFVVSIREDDLYRLEDSIDNCYLPALKRCRYRLRSLSEQGARDAILIPGEGLFRPEEQEQIVSTIIGIARNKEDGSISTNLLSLVCSRIFVDFQKSSSTEFITQSLVEGFVKGNPFERFYDEATRGFSNREKSYIEEHLVDSTGRRNSIPESDFLLHVPKGASLLEGNSRILQRTSVSSDGESYRIELIHDSFCEPLANRNAKRKRQKRLYAFVTAIGIVGIALLIMAVILMQNNENQRVTKLMQENKMRSIAGKAQLLLTQGDSYSARALLLECLKSYNAGEYSPEIEASIRQAYDNNTAILRGHTSSIVSTKYSPDGKTIMSASYDGTIRLWDSQTGACLDTIFAHDIDIECAEFSRDGKMIISGAHDGTVKIWDTKSKKDILSIQPFKGSITNSATFSGDGKEFMITGYNKEHGGHIQIWNIEDKKVTRLITSSDVGLYHAVYSPDGKCIAAVSTNKEVKVFDAVTGICQRTIVTGHSWRIHQVTYSPDGRMLATVSRDGTCKVWNAVSGKLLHTLKGHNDVVVNSTFSNDSRSIVTSSYDQTLRMWNVADGSCTKIFYGHTIFVISPCFSPDGLQLVSGSVDGTVRLWDVPKTEEQNVCWLDDSVMNVTACYSPDGKLLACAGKDTIIRLYDIQARKLVRKLQGHTDIFTTIVFNNDGQSLFSIARDSTLRRWSIADGGCKVTKLHKQVQRGDISTDGNVAYTIFKNSLSLCFFSYNGNADCEDLPVDSVVYACISRDGRMIAAISSDDSVNVWDTETMLLKRQFHAGKDGVRSIQFTPDGGSLALTYMTGDVKTWFTKTGEPAAVMWGHTGTVYNVAFSYDGRYAVTVSHDATVRLWDAASGTYLYTGPKEQFREVVFNPAKTEVALIGYDGEITIWSFPPLQQLIDETRERFKDRPLTKEERHKYYLE